MSPKSSARSQSAVRASTAFSTTLPAVNRPYAFPAASARSVTTKPSTFVTGSASLPSRPMLNDSRGRSKSKPSSRSVVNCTLAKPHTPTAIKQVENALELDGLLTQQPDGKVSVLMCSASYCAGCRGVAPKYAKIAKAYDASDDDEVSFMKMDYVANEQFCRSSLGAENLPFFVVFKDGHIVSAEAIGWRTVAKKLVDRIETAISFPDSQLNALPVPGH